MLKLHFFIFAIFLSCAGKNIYKTEDHASDSVDEIQSIKLSIENKKIVIEATSTYCFLKWDYENGTIDVQNYQCMKSLEESRPIMNQMYARLIKEIGQPEKIKSFGGHVRNFFDLEQRVAIYAYKSDQWDSVSGTPTKAKDINEFILNYANSNNIYYELTAFFGEKCFDIKLHKTEQASVLRASSLSYYPYLREFNVKRRAKLPADYFIWFNINPKHKHCFAN